MSDLDDAEHIRQLARRLADLRLERIRAASRACSALEAVIRPLRDRRLLDLTFLLQTALSERLSDRPEVDAG